MNQKLRERVEKAALNNHWLNVTTFQVHIGGFKEGAEWMHKEEVVPLQTALFVAHEALLWADEMFTARDTMNAKVHCSPIRLSPITLRVKQALELIEKTKGGEG